MARVDFFIGDAEEAHLSKCAVVHSHERFDGVDGREDTAFHIAGARAIDSVTFDPRWPTGSGANGITVANGPKRRHITASLPSKNPDQTIPQVCAWAVRC